MLVLFAIFYLWQKKIMPELLFWIIFGALLVTFLSLLILVVKILIEIKNLKLMLQKIGNFLDHHTIRASGKIILMLGFILMFLELIIPGFRFGLIEVITTYMGLIIYVFGLILYKPRYQNFKIKGWQLQQLQHFFLTGPNFSCLIKC